jgi:hypothetical protein
MNQKTNGRLVRDQAFKAMNMFMARLTAMVKDMVGFMYQCKYVRAKD